MNNKNSDQGRSNESGSASADKAARIRQLLEDFLRRRMAGEILADHTIIAAHPDLMPELAEELRKLALIQEADQIARQEESTAMGSSGLSPSPTARATPTSLPPDSFAGYELLREVHRGGQGIVYQAIQKSTNRMVAIKVMKEGPFAGAADRARFEREVQILGQLQHPNIVAIHDSGSAAGCFYFVMDYISGQPLDVYMASGTRSIDETLKLFAKICEAVNAAHLRGIIHRDLKPGNIRVDPSGEPHILDFGLAKVSAFESIGEGGSPVMTVTGQFIGSLPWASPEQAEGQPSKIDVRTDVYSLGVILYQMLTGKFPYEVVGAMRDVLDRILTCEPARPSTIRKQINDEVETIVLKCLSKERERRYQTAGELARDIGHYLAGKPVDAKRDSVMYVLRKQLRRHRVSFVFGLVILLILIGSSVVAWTLYGVARGRLWETYLSSAEATRKGTLPGRKLKSLDAIRQAAAIRATKELRDEAIAAMALMDVRLDRAGDSPGQPGANALFSPGLDKIAVHHLESGIYSVHEWGSNKRLLDLSGTPQQRLWPRFSNNGQLVARCDKSECQIWNVGQRTLFASFPLEQSMYTHADFRSDDRQFAVGDRNGAVHIHDLSTRETRVLPIAKTHVRRVRFHPNGSVLALSLWESNIIILVEILSGQVSATLPHPDIVAALAWSPDGRSLAVGCDDGRVYFWDSSKKTIELTLTGHTGLPVSLFFCGRGDLLCSYAWDGTSRFWDIRLGTHLLTLPFAIDAFEPNSDRFGYEVNAQMTQLGKGEILESDIFSTLYPFGAEGRYACYSIATSRDGRLVASGGGSHGIQIWDISSRKRLASIPIDVHEVVFRTNPSELISSGLSNGVQRWPIQRLGDTTRIGPPIQASPSSWRCEGAALAADNATLVVAANQRDIAIFNLNDQNPSPRILGQHANARYVSIDAAGRRVASGGNHPGPDGKLRIWDVAHGKLLHSIPQTFHQGVCLSRDGSLLVHSGHTAHSVWDTDTWGLRAEFARSNSGPSPSAAFSPAGDVLALNADDRSIELVSVADMQIIARLENPDSISHAAMAWSADGTKLLVPNARGHSIHVWDLRTMRGHLAEMGLDWELPPYPPAPPSLPTDPLRVQVELGDLDRSRDDGAH